MIYYTVYETATGRILRTGTALTEASARLQGSKPGTSVTLVGSDPKTDIIDVTPIGVDPGTLPRQPMRTVNGLTFADKTTINANGNDMVTIHYIPPGALCEIYLPPNLGLVQPPDQIVGSEANVQITTTVPGIYQVKISYQNFMDFEVTFNAN